MYYKVARQIYKELAVKHELPIDTIEQICRAPLEMFDWITKNKTDKETLTYPSLRISGFGVFYVSKETLIRKKRRYSESNFKAKFRGVQPSNESNA